MMHSHLHKKDGLQSQKAMPVQCPVCRLNLASFVTTWMEPEAEKLITESINVSISLLSSYRHTHKFGSVMHAGQIVCVDAVACKAAAHLQKCAVSCIGELCRC